MTTPMIKTNRSKLFMVAGPQHFQQKVMSDFVNQGITIYSADEFEEAEKMLADKSLKFDSIFIDPDFDESGGGVRLLKSCHKHRFAVPIFLVSKELLELGEQLSLRELGVRGMLQDPNDIHEVVKTIEEKLTQFDSDKAIDMSVSGQDPLEKEGGATNEDFCPIQASYFLAGSQSFFDVYVKIRSQKFIKILNAGESFESEQLERYFSKGLQYFYVRKDIQQVYLDYCDRLTARILGSKKISTNVKVGQTLNHGDTTVRFLQNNGLDDNTVIYAQNYASNVFTAVWNVCNDSKSVNTYLKDIAQVEHSAGTAMIAGILAAKMGAGSQDSIEILGVASTLHDIGLYYTNKSYDEGEEFKYFDELSLQLDLEKETLAASRRRELQKAYTIHPEKGADMISMIDNINPLVPQVVAQHHMTIDSSGFPKAAKGVHIHQFSQILGLSEEYANLIKGIANCHIMKEELMTFPARLNSYSGQVRRAFKDSFLKFLS